MAFSANYPTYRDWREAQSKISTYAKQIDRLHALYPKASLSQLRRHPTKKQDPLTKLKKKPNRLPPIESFTELQQDRYERSLEAIRYMRRYGLSLTQAAQRVNLSPETVKHMVGKALEISNARYIAKPHDRCERNILFYDDSGPIVIKIRSSKTASLMGKYHAAVKKYTETGDFSGVLDFEGKSITDAIGNRYEFIIQKNCLMSLYDPAKSVLSQFINILYREVIEMEYSVERQDLLRNEKRLQKLGSDRPVCCLCGYSDPIGLIPVSNTLLEKHHIAGRHEGLVVPVCRNCHAELTEIQQFHDKKFNSPERTPLETAAAFLNGLSTFFSILAETLRYLANWLFDLDKRIDAQVYEGLPFPLGGGVTNA